MKAFQKTCEQMFWDDALKEQVEWMKKKCFWVTPTPKKLSRDWKKSFFKNGTVKLTKKEIIKDVIVTNLWDKVKAEFVRSGSIWCYQNHLRLQERCHSQGWDQWCKKHLKKATDKKKPKSNDESICHKNKTQKWSKYPNNKK